MSADHVERERKVQALAREIFVRRPPLRHGIKAAIEDSFQQAVWFFQEAELRERRARRKPKGKK